METIWVRSIITPTLDVGIREDLLKCLDEEIMATQHRYDEAQRKLKERRWATSYQPSQFENSTTDGSRNNPNLPVMNNKVLILGI